jgi:hypothetical protein
MSQPNILPHVVLVLWSLFRDDRFTAYHHRTTHTSGFFRGPTYLVPASRNVMNADDRAFVISLFMNSILLSTILFIWLRTQLTSRSTDHDTETIAKSTDRDDIKPSYFGPVLESSLDGGGLTSTRDDTRHKDGAKREVFDDAYIRIYQRYNKDRHTWEEFTPNARDPERLLHEGIIFIVYYRANPQTFGSLRHSLR